MDITSGQVIVSLTSLGVSTMLGFLLKDVRTLKKKAMTNEEHETKCELAKATVKIAWREDIKAELTEAVKEIKDHVDKVVKHNGNGR